MPFHSHVNDQYQVARSSMGAAGNWWGSIGTASRSRGSNSRKTSIIVIKEATTEATRPVRIGTGKGNWTGKLWRYANQPQSEDGDLVLRPVVHVVQLVLSSKTVSV